MAQREAERIARVIYLYHSGFAVEIGKRLFIFDYLAHGNRAELSKGGIDPLSLSAYQQVFLFVTHAHTDHYDEAAVAQLCQVPNVKVILSSDVPIKAQGNRLSPGGSLTLSDVSVHAYESTDEGVAFGVVTPQATLFHAGDLNWWHWREESSLQEVEQAETDFKRIVKTIALPQIDLAFFPVDPRQGAFYDVGAAWFAQELKPRFLFPMHFQEREDAVADFVRRTQVKNVGIVPLTKPGSEYIAKWQI